MYEYARTDMPISFPGLFGDWSVNPNPVAIPIGNGIRWYGIIICTGLILAVLFCCRQSKKYGITEDNIYDMMIWQIPLCIIGARLYYVIFYLDLFRNADGSLNPGRMIAIWDGGLAIYGAIITAYLVLHIFCRKKKISFGAFADLGAMGLLIGQAVGRWGNFVNREAFGGETTLPWRMRVWVTASEYIEVHPTFLYESLWNLIGLGLIVFVIAKRRSFDGENACFYFIWYGLGRAWIEGLRTDSLYFFDWILFGQPIRVSQALSAVMAAVAALALFYEIKIKRHSPQDLLVNRLAAEAAAQAEQEAIQAEPEAAQTEQDAPQEAEGGGDGGQA